MCGLSGYFAFAGSVGSTDSLLAMQRALAHRGPDGEGVVFVNTQSGSRESFTGRRTPLTPPELKPVPRTQPHDLAMGHSRFAILDQTPGGHQPFELSEAALVLAFNGEIYNHVELRSELARAGHVFHTRGDAEVFAHAWLEWGEECLPRLRGFFSMTLWDGRSRSFWLARDPIGKAPMYVARHAGRLWWSSEIKGLRSGAGQGAFAPRAAAIAEFVGAGMRDFGNKTFFEGVETFPAGSVARVAADGSFEPRRYWAPPATRMRAADIGPEEAVAGLTDRLRTSVRLRLRADAPVGLELSGGMDSSAIAALAAREHAEGGAGVDPLRAHTVSFAGTASDESHFARMVAAHHPSSLHLTDLPHGGTVTPEGVARYHQGMDEPFHSPVLMLNREMWRRMAASGLRVSLNGGGGDEVFAGYGGEYLGPYVRGLLANGRIVRAMREIGSYSERDAHVFRSFARAAWWMVPENLRKELRPSGPPPELNPLTTHAFLPMASDRLEQRLLDHLGDWKMNYWMRSGNTACMGLPVEVRLPLLDTKVVEWACRLPPEYLIRDGWLKWALRKAVEPDLPAEVVWRRVKMGFPFPIGDWLRAARPALESLRHGEDPPLLPRARVFQVYDRLAVSHPAYLWRCLSVLMWWDQCVCTGAIPVALGEPETEQTMGTLARA